MARFFTGRVKICWLETSATDFYELVIQTLAPRCEKGLNDQGNYVESKIKVRRIHSKQSILETWLTKLCYCKTELGFRMHLVIAKKSVFLKFIPRQRNVQRIDTNFLELMLKNKKRRLFCIIYCSISVNDLNIRVVFDERGPLRAQFDERGP